MVPKSGKQGSSDQNNIVNIADNKIKIAENNRQFAKGSAAVEQEKEKKKDANWSSDKASWDWKKKNEASWDSKTGNKASWDWKKEKKGDWDTTTEKKASWDWKPKNEAARDTKEEKTASWDTKSEKSASWDKKSESTYGYWAPDSGEGVLSEFQTTTLDPLKDAMIEEREYPETVLICAHFKGSFEKKGLDNHMRIGIENSKERIAQYLQGDNSKNEHLDSNEPVFYGMTTTHPEFVFETCRWLFQNGQLDSAPLPTNGGVNLKRMPKKTFYVRKFDITDPEDEGSFWQMETSKLKSELMELNLKFDEKNTYGTQDSQNKRKSEILLEKE